MVGGNRSSVKSSMGFRSPIRSYEKFDLAPFHLPQWEGNSRPKVHRAKSRSYFSLDPRKHPVSILHEYCSMQSIIPTFEFYEIPQKVGIEYGCIVTVENYIGEGRAFSKKIAKHQASINLLRKLSRPNYVGDNDLGPRRFVSETGIVSVHFESTPRKRSCFRNRSRMTPPPFLKREKKKVKWQDSSGGETEDESLRSSCEDLSCTDTVDSKLTMDCDDDTEEEIVSSRKLIKIETDDSEINSDNEQREREGRFKCSSSSSAPVEKKQNKDNGGSQDLIEEISDYLSERLRKTSIDQTIETKEEVIEESTSGEIKVIELNDIKNNRKKRRKRSDGMYTDTTHTLERKICLKEVNPIGYLQEACMHFGCDPPSYIFYQDGGRIKAVCTLVDSNTEAFGETLREAKRAAAVLMIRELGW